MTREDPPAGLTIRTLGAGDSFEDLTDLLHRAYARLGAMGLNYTAVDQTVATTKYRATRGTCLVAMLDGRLVGTLAMHGPDPESACVRYRRAGVLVLGQLAVEPGLQTHGIGRALMEEAERRARSSGAEELLGDTAEGAAHLIQWYGAMDWSVVATVKWPGKTYRSVVLAKALAPEPGVRSRR